MALTLEPLAVLLAHDRWATARLLDACDGLTSEQLHRRVEMGIGSLHDTIIHDAAAVRLWAEVLARREVSAWPTNDARPMGELRRMVEGAFELFASVAGGPAGDLFTRQRDGKTYTYTRVGIVAHVHTHGVHHRAQCINMMRQLGVSPLPQSSVVEWMRAEEPL